MTKKVPEVRFKGFTDDWEQHQLGDFGSVSMNKRILKKQTVEQGVPFYKIGTFGGKADSFIPRELFNEYKAKYPFPKKGDILLSASGSIGRTVVYHGEDAYFQDSNIVWLNHNSSIRNSFLKYFYQNVNWNTSEGSTIKRLYNKTILNTIIILPIRTDEQLKIGKIINLVDSLIALYQRKLVILMNTKQMLLQNLFVSDNQKTPMIRFKDFNNNWGQRTLKSFTNNYSGLTYSPSDISEVGTWVLRSSNVQSDEIVHKDDVYVNKNDLNVELVRKKDVIVVVRNGSRNLIGKHALLNCNLDNAVIGAFMTGFRGNGPFVDSLFSTDVFKQEVHKSLGATINQITKKDFQLMRFTLPLSQDEMDKIGRFFLILKDTIALYQNQIDLHQKIKKMLLQKLFI